MRVSTTGYQLSVYKLEENNLNTGGSHTFNNLDFCFNTWSLFSSLCHKLAKLSKPCVHPSVFIHTVKGTHGLLVCIWGNCGIAFCPEMIRLISGLSCHESSSHTVKSFIYHWSMYISSDSRLRSVISRNVPNQKESE